MGPWHDTTTDLNPKAGLFSDRPIQAQESFVIRTNTTASEGTFIYVGDRWVSAPDHLKSHDFQYWQPLKFNDSVSPPTISPLYFVDSFSLELA